MSEIAEYAHSTDVPDVHITGLNDSDVRPQPINGVEPLSRFQNPLKSFRIVAPHENGMAARDAVFANPKLVRTLVSARGMLTDGWMTLGDHVMSREHIDPLGNTQMQRIMNTEQPSHG